MTREEIDLLYDHWLATNEHAPHHMESHGWGRSAWHEAFKVCASQSEAEGKDYVRVPTYLVRELLSLRIDALGFDPLFTYAMKELSACLPSRDAPEGKDDAKS